MQKDDIDALFNLEDDQTWLDLTIWLMSHVEIWVNNAQISNWYGQRREISEDLVQDAIARIYIYYQQSRRGKTQPINSLKAFSRSVAHNLFQDKIKKEKRLIRLTIPLDSESFLLPQGDLTLIEEEDTLRDLASIIATFPPKQKGALLIDLANRHDFTDQPSRLEQALQMQGICLRSHQRPTSTCVRERRQLAVLRFLAYRRLQTEFQRLYGHNR